MPFTPTHIAAIVPVSFFSRGRLPFSALVIGSQIPDLPMFLPGFPWFNERSLHTPLGLAAGCLPLGLLGFLWFQAFAKEPLVELLPVRLRQRLQSFCQPALEPTYAFFVGVLVAIAIGAATHLFWDSFTHYDYWGYRLLPRMNREVFAYGDYSLELYKALQYGSSIVFLPLMALMTIGWLKRRPVESVPAARLSQKQRAVWTTLLLFLAPLAAAIWSVPFYFAVSLRAFAVECVTTVGMLQLLLASAFAAYYRTLAALPNPEFGQTLPVTESLTKVRGA